MLHFMNSDGIELIRYFEEINPNKYWRNHRKEQ